MGESQSRYSIMDELNSRKIAQKEKLANIEKESDQHIYDKNLEVEKIEESIKSKEASYKVNFTERQRQRQVNLKMIENDFNRTKAQLEDDMKDDKDNYESRFQEWKKSEEEKIKSIKADLVRYKKIQDKKIADKKSIIAEIDAGIKSLKEMSAEQQSTD